MGRFLAIVAIVLMASFSAQAQVDQTKPPSIMQKILQVRQGEMAAMDANNDKKLELKELLAVIPQKFTAMDANGDGFLDTKEIVQYMMTFEKSYANLYGETLEAHSERMLRHLEAADDDKDGKVSYNEYAAYMTHRYTRFDINQDGIISADEYKIDSEKL